MKTGRLIAPLLLAALLPACVTTSASSWEWGEQAQPEWTRPGRVASIRETHWREDGNPVGGAVAGAVVGGLLSGAIGGRPEVGMIGGAMVGAAASQGSAQGRTYEVFVRFDDGGAEPFRFDIYDPYAPMPFRVGEAVMLTPRGLLHR